MKLKQLFFSLIIITVLSSCEVPIHEEYGLDGTIHNNDDDGNGENSEDTFWPLANDNVWHYDQATILEEYEQDISVIGSEVFNDKTYFKLEMTTTSFFNPTTQIIHLRRENNVFTYRIVVNQNGVVSDPIYSHPLKDNISVGDSWEETINIQYSGTINATIPSHYTYTYEEFFEEMDVNGTLYQNVAKIKTHLEAEYQGQTTITDTYNYYALNVGPVQTIGEGLITVINSYTLN